MCLIVDDNYFSFSGGTYVRANERNFEIIQPGIPLQQFTIEEKIQWLKVAPNGKTVLVYGANGTSIIRWRNDLGIDPFGIDTGKRKSIGCGFIMAGEKVITMLYKDEVLKGFSDDGSEHFFSNVESPHSFRPRSFVNLPGDRVAMAGYLFGDFADSFITVELASLLQHPNAIQQAIESKDPHRDRAIDLTVGPADPDSFVVLRDPKDEEIPIDEEDEEDLKDVQNFAGVYIRNLQTGILTTRCPYHGRAGSDSPIAATKNLIVVQVHGGIDIIDRITGDVRNMPETILDVTGRQVVKINNGNISEIIPLDALT